MKRNQTISDHFKYLVTGIIISLCPLQAMALNANFSLKAQYSRNKKIWGTYKLNQERLSIKRGKKKWFKKPTSRVGDIIISNGHIVFIRETKELGKTKIVVDKIPYEKKGKYTYINKGPLDKEIMDRLYRPDLKSITPHHDLLEGTIQYNELECNRVKRKITCTLQGDMIPSNEA